MRKKRTIGHFVKINNNAENIRIVNQVQWKLHRFHPVNNECLMPKWGISRVNQALLQEHRCHGGSTRCYIAENIKEFNGIAFLCGENRSKFKLLGKQKMFIEMPCEQRTMQQLTIVNIINTSKIILCQIKMNRKIFRD